MFITGKKAGVPVSIILVVVLTFSLVLYTVFLFNVRIGDVSEDFGNYLIIDDLYRDVQALNLNLEKSLDVSLISDNFESDFNLRIETLKEKYSFDILSKNIDFFSDGYEAELEVFMVSKNEDHEVWYQYKKTFINK